MCKTRGFNTWPGSINDPKRVMAQYFAGVACNSAERVEFVEAEAELEPSRIRQIKRFLEWDRAPTSRRNEAQPKRMIVL